LYLNQLGPYDEMGGTCSMCGRDEGHMPSWEHERKRPFWRRRFRRESNTMGDKCGVWRNVSGIS
jgi:hypothetical protein